MSFIRSFLVYVGALGILALGVFGLGSLGNFSHTTESTPPESHAQAAATVSPVATSTSQEATSSTVVKSQATQAKPRSTISHTSALPTKQVSNTTPTSSHDGDVYRIENPYPFAPSSTDAVNVWTRAALVNIFCVPYSGSFKSISGSGVIIDPRGVILTNAHVAQYLLLAQSPKVNLTCTIRSGAPAHPEWKAEVLYIPPTWVNAHAADLRVEHPTGTGEHDYALLRITGTINGSPLPTFPAMSVDVRDGVTFLDDQVLLAGYPAEFIGGITSQMNLYPVSSVTTIKDVFTMATSTIDVVSLGGVIQAQGGSSGGAVSNLWNYLVGIITTTSEGKTTGQRDLHALTLSYIDRDMRAQFGSGLKEMLAGDIEAKAVQFAQDVAPGLIDTLVAQLPVR